ncbi:acyltransferase [Acinetobacter haemolyticus]|uniref:acyltransferase n=1 Tax=Acinetobacter haemolyticus TaxID=29430 RepID=UPI003EF48D5A
MRKRELLSKFDFIIKILVSLLGILPRRVRKFFLDSLYNCSGMVAIGLRYCLLKTLLKSCGDNISIHKNVILLGIENLEIGDNVSIHPFCYIDGTGSLKIGNDVSIAHSSTILSTEHVYSDVKIPIKDQGIENIPTVLENNIWIACGVRILAGSWIHDGVVIAAGAVVKGEILSHTIYGGIPAKLIKRR